MKAKQNPRSNSKKSREKPPGYDSNATRVLAHSILHASPRAVQAARVAAEQEIFNKQGRPSTVAEIQDRYNFTEEAAKKFLQAVARAKRKKNATAVDRLTASARAPELEIREAHATPASERHQAADGVNLEKTLLTQNACLTAELAGILASIRNRFETEIRTKGEQTAVKEGFLYLITHPCFDGWLKAGMTIDFEMRLATYNVADPLSRFKFSAIKWVDDRRQAEIKLLARLSDIAIEVRGEWFRLDLGTAKAFFDWV